MKRPVDEVDAIEEPETPETPRTPKVFRLHKMLSRTLSMNPSVHESVRSSDGSWYGGTLMSNMDPPKFEQSFTAPSFIVKVLQMAISIACLGLFIDSCHLVRNNVSTKQFPFIVFCSSIIINSVIISSYILGMKMRELLMRLFHILGAILFLAAGMVVLHVVLVYWPAWSDDLEDYDPEYGDYGETGVYLPSLPRRRCLILVQIILSFMNCALHIADVSYSIKRTIALI